MTRILVTPRSVTQHGHPSLTRLTAAGFEVVFGPQGRQPSEDELVHLLRDCSGYLAGVERVSARALAAAPALRAISRNGVGVDNIDLGAAAAQGVAVLRADGTNARGVAELAVGLIFALARGIAPVDAALKQGQWTRGEGFELEGKTLGLFGCGRIGQSVARIAGALGMHVLAHDPFAEGRFAPGPFFAFAPEARVFAGSDIISLHCPPPSDGRPLFNADTLRTVKAGVMIVNTARFELIDRDAMLDALDRGQVAGLALDVFAEEPCRDTALLRHPRVLATSHIGGYTRESIDRAMNAAVENLLRELVRQPA